MSSLIAVHPGLMVFGPLQPITSKHLAVTGSSRIIRLDPSDQRNLGEIASNPRSQTACVS